MLNRSRPQVITHEDTLDLTLDEEQLAALGRLIPGAVSRAADYGIAHNLEVFASSFPGYLGDKLLGPATVPCYAGWYFVMVLGNGSVMFCCQCAEPVGRIMEGRRFIDIWPSLRYRNFRTAARKLPESNELMSSCGCDQCALRVRNLSIHNFIRPWKRVSVRRRLRRYSLPDITKK